MKKSYLIAMISAVVLLILLGASYWYMQPKNNESGAIIETSGGTETSDATGSASEEVLPVVSTNPLDNKPNINPADQTNPFKNIKTNPFE